MWEITLTHYLTVAAILFTIGVFGIFLNRKNVIIILMSVELILLAGNINLVAFSSFLGDMVGQVFVMLVLTVAAAEAAIGLAILVVEIIFVVSTGAMAPAIATLAGSPTPAGVSNTQALGQILYTDYFYLFQAAGIVLLIAMIGAIVLAHREREGVKRQRIAAQLVRDHRSVEIRKVPTGTGI